MQINFPRNVDIGNGLCTRKTVVAVLVHISVDGKVSRSQVVIEQGVRLVCWFTFSDIQGSNDSNTQL
ncbi:hypothetical protein DPMN_158677 [Dreissena polymorpha]|uniref:Uncharacterized protein n=1 Tax=Dreissena polymorpha TaxID=45954 RepID=A0A9D4EK81_DREPO|nr:hypothetical protein DPMN_158677 [Dreissena polymorpha]